MIISRTPYRVSFFGGGTDYPAWFQEHGGAVLGMSIDKYCYITLRYLPPFFEHKYRIVYSRTEEVRLLGEIQHPLVREAIRASGIEAGLEIHHDGDLPARSGIGSSSSFAVGILHALHALRGEARTPFSLAGEAIRLEQDVLHETVGCQDQILAAVGGLNMITFGQTIKVDRVAAPSGLVDHLLMVFTGFQRLASEIAEEQVKSIGAKKGELAEMMTMAPEAGQLLESGQFDSFGKLMSESWQLKRSLTSRISNQYIDFLYDKGMQAGAYGGKLLGAGGGGFLLFVVSPEKREEVIKALGSLLEVPIRLDTEGTKVIFANGAY